MVLNLSGLLAYDAEGRALLGWFTLRGKELLMHVDDAGAKYPLVMDPFVQQTELTALALVAVPGETVGSNALQGAACVFARAGGLWSQEQE